MLAEVRAALARGRTDAADDAREPAARLRGEELEILFRLARRPEVLWGYRIEAVPEEGPGSWEPVGWAGVVLANWREAYLAADARLPEPRPGACVTWIRD